MQTYRLHELCELRTGYTFRRAIKTDTQGDCGVIQIKDIGPQSTIKIKDVARIDQHQVKKQHFLRPGDVLLPARGKPRHCVLFDFPGRWIATSQFIVIVVKDRSRLHPAFLAWYLNQHDSQQKLRRLATGSGIRMLSKADVSQLTLHCPCIAQQQLIAKLSWLADQEQVLYNRLRQARHAWVESQLRTFVSSR